MPAAITGRGAKRWQLSSQFTVGHEEIPFVGSQTNQDSISGSKLYIGFVCGLALENAQKTDTPLERPPVAAKIFLKLARSKWALLGYHLASWTTILPTIIFRDYVRVLAYNVDTER